MSFEWQTEEDGDWDDPILSSSDPDEQKSEAKRRWWRWLIPLGLLVVSLTAAGWTLNQRFQLGTERVETEVLASYNLVNQAVAQQDDELVWNVLSGRDEAWASLVTEAVEQGVLMNRDGLGLAQIAVTDPITPTIEISADLKEAVVKMIVPYAIEIGNGLTETIELEQTAVYRLGASNRWLLAPPELSFWGDIRQVEGQFVNLFYPERDKEIAQDLLLSLDAKIGQLCSQLSDVDCPSDYQIIVELDTNPEAFAQLDLSSAAMNADRQHLILPTPTLVGFPLDQTGERAMFRGYGQLAVGAVLTDLWGYDCCDQTSPLYFSVLNDSLRQLGLMPWPGETAGSVMASDFDLMLDDGIPPLFNGAVFWYELEDDELVLPDKRAEILIAFARDLGLTTQELMVGLNNLRFSQSFGEWLLSYPNSNLSARELENAWLNFVYDNSSFLLEPPPSPAPDQDIQLLCQIGGEERMAFYRYNLAENETILEQPLNRFVDKMIALPNDNGLAVWEDEGEESLTQMFIWKDGEKSQISWDAAENAPSPVPLHVDPTNSKLILAPAQFDQMNYGLLDVPSCVEDSCQLETLVGYPIWSPDLAHMILLNGAMLPPHEAHTFGRLILADSAGEEIRPLSLGSSPFWLDADTFGFVPEEDEGNRHTIVVGRIDDTDDQDWDVLLTVAELTAVLNDDHTRLIDFVSIDPQNPDQLVVVTSSQDKNVQTFFVYDLIKKEVVSTHSFSVKEGRNQSYRFSPNGRFLLMSQYEFEGNQQNRLFIIDLANGETSHLSLEPNPESSVHWVTDFSEDGEWLLVSDESMLYLLLLGTDYHRLIFNETGACKTAVFVNKNS